MIIQISCCERKITKNSDGDGNEKQGVLGKFEALLTVGNPTV